MWCVRVYTPPYRLSADVSRSASIQAVSETHWIRSGEGKCERVSETSVYRTSKSDSICVLVGGCTVLSIVASGVVVLRSQAEVDLVIASFVPVAFGATGFPATGVCKAVQVDLQIAATALR